MSRQDEVFEWVRARYKGALWPEADQRKWFGWYWTDARVLVASEAGRVVGVTLARLVNDPIRADQDPAYHEENGSIAYIDASVNTAGPRAWQAMCQSMHLRFPNTLGIAFRRLGRPERVRVYPFRTFLNRLEKIHHG